MNNNTENFACEMERLEKEYEIRQIREDLPGDVLAGAKLVQAACDKNWDEVAKMLEAGADPRICRQACASGEIIPALYMALKDKQFELADKLYDAGDRLDDFVEFIDSCGTCPDVVFAFLARSMHCGRNFFYDESKTLSEYCRCSAFKQIEKLLPTADKAELAKSVEPTVSSWIRYFHNTDTYAEILKALAHYGAKLSPEKKAEILSVIDRRFGNCPEIMSPGKEKVDIIINLIKSL